MIEAIVKANQTRKDFITAEVLRDNPEVIGIYRLTMKAGSDNFRSSAIQDIINNLKEQNKKIIIYEPTLKEDSFNECEIEKDLEKFKANTSIIMANRLEKELEDVKEKVYTRDIYSKDS